MKKDGTKQKMVYVGRGGSGYPIRATVSTTTLPSTALTPGSPPRTLMLRDRDAFRAPAGREVEPPNRKAVHSGRGGTGNAHRLFREDDVFERVLLHEKGLVETLREERAKEQKTSGRGGLGTLSLFGTKKKDVDKAAPPKLRTSSSFEVISDTLKPLSPLRLFIPRRSSNADISSTQSRRESAIAEDDEDQAASSQLPLTPVSPEPSSISPRTSIASSSKRRSRTSSLPPCPPPPSRPLPPSPAASNVVPLPPIPPNLPISSSPPRPRPIYMHEPRPTLFPNPSYSLTIPESPPISRNPSSPSLSRTPSSPRPLAMYFAPAAAASSTSIIAESDTHSHSSGALSLPSPPNTPITGVPNGRGVYPSELLAEVDYSRVRIIA